MHSVRVRLNDLTNIRHVITRVVQILMTDKTYYRYGKSVCINRNKYKNTVTFWRVTILWPDNTRPIRTYNFHNVI